MKWGKKKSKKSPWSASSKPSFISHVFPTSWLSKFKQMSIHSKPNTVRETKKNGKQNSSTIESPVTFYAGGSNGRFYSGDGDAFWRLSFGDDEFQDDKSKGVMSSEWCDEYFVQPLASHHCRQNSTQFGRERHAQESKDKIMGLKGTWNEPKDLDFEVDMEVHDQDKEFETLRRRFERKTQREFRDKVLELKIKAVEADMKLTTEEERDVLHLESPTRIWTPRKHCLLSPSKLDKPSPATKEEDFMFSTHELDTAPVQMKSELPKLKSERQRKSLHVSSRKSRHNSKVRVHSPKMASKVEIFKVKALEDMKKAKLKMKAKDKRIVEETDADLDSFAVVKCSYNPQKDFRDSMLEMITEKQIMQPEEMEELLACYLTLNSDEYHDIIIKVFRQVWFELNQVSFGIE